MGAGASAVADKLEEGFTDEENELMQSFTMGHDLTQKAEHEKYMKLASLFYKKKLETLRSIEKEISSTQADAFKYSTMLHIALKNAISKKLFETMPAIHCTVVFALYKENNRILPKGDEEGKSHKNGEDFIRRKHEQMTWLFENKPDSSWTMLGCDDGCPLDSAGLGEGIVKEMGYTNVKFIRLKEAIMSGAAKAAGLDEDKLKSEAWDEGDKLVKASQKAGAILYGLKVASDEKVDEGKRHIIVYTDSDLSTDLALCGLNFDTIINGNVECSVSQRFGQPFSVNCGKLMTDEEGGGIAPGMPNESRIHLTLRHKLRMNLLPPLAPITDTNCGHKALTPETAIATVSKVKDYKGSFDIDWLMCVGVCAKAAGKEAIATTAIPWVNSVGESNFWSAPSGEEDAAAKKLKSATSWHGIFAKMTEMYGWHKDELEKLGLVTEESKAYVEWVSKMDVNQYMKLSDAILAKLEGQDINMPEKTIMDMSLDELKQLAGDAPSAAPAAATAPKFEDLWPAYEEKMKADGCNDAAINAFKANFKFLCSGESPMIPESTLSAVDDLPTYESLTVEPDQKLLQKTVIMKLNGGLGTGMGLEQAKSLLPVIDGNSFLDLIAKQVDWMKTEYDQKDLKFMLMNSFATSKDTLEALSKYPDLGTGSDLEFQQNKAPKVTKDGYAPASWPAGPDNEWCPPGHGDLYPAMLGSGALDKLLEGGFQYMFVSNSDNLGATMDLKILTHFAQSEAPFMMEVASRTDADKKGGHLAKVNEGGGLTLRESAQCPPEDEKAFQDITKYKYFNTNNLWVDLVKLKALFDKAGGAVPLPVMLNEKTVDPRDKKSTKVLQLETAMGAAISAFEGATALLIPRSRFAPVKKTDDLIALRSDAYTLTKDFRIELAPARNGVPPLVKLDDRYKFVDAMNTLIPNGVPSLIACNKLTIKGEVEFEAGVEIVGDVTISNAGEGKKVVAAGKYENQTVEL